MLGRLFWEALLGVQAEYLFSGASMVVGVIPLGGLVLGHWALPERKDEALVLRSQKA